MPYTKRHSPWVENETVIHAADMDGIEAGIATAQTTAENAQSAASTAQGAASTAQTTANTAQSTANTASTNASNAQTTANAAQAKANLAAGPWQFFVSDYGAVGDGKVVNDIVTTSGSAIITSATAGWTSADVGKKIMINGGLDPAGGPHITSILSFQSSTQVTLAANATRTGTGLAAVWGTDDQAAINSAISAAKTYALANRYFAEIVFADKTYILASAPTQSTSPAVYNSQIPIPTPAVDGTSRKLVISLKGAGSNDHVEYWQTTTPNLAGTALVSMQTAPNTLDVTYGAQSVIGGPSGNAGLTGGFANTKVSVEGIMVVCPAYTNMTAYDFTWLGGMHMDKSSAHTFANPVQGPEPVLNTMVGQVFFQTRVGVGLRMPANGDNADSTVPSLAVEGYHVAVNAGDHATFGRLITMYNDVAMYVDSSIGLGGIGHNLTIGNWAAEVYNGGLRNNGGYVQVHIVMASEVISPAYDISDTSNGLYGEIWWSDPSDSRSMVVTNASNLTVHNNKKSTVQYAGALFEKVVALTDAATIATDASLGNVFTITLGGNRTLGAPTNPTNGQLISYMVVQDATGTRTLTYNAAFSTNGIPTLQTAAGSIDVLQFRYLASASKWVYVK